jgi:hypothetical protein
MKELEMYRQEEICVLESVHSRITERMPRVHYEKIKSYILTSLESEKEITFYDLLAGAEKQQHLLVLGGNLSWYLLKVKQDLEAKRIIRMKKSSTASKVLVIIRARSRELKGINQY